MKTIIKTSLSLIAYILIGQINIAIASDETFATYKRLSKNISTNQGEVQSFIESDNYLSDRLRNKYLNVLAKKRDWSTYLAFYKATNSNHQYCQYLRAYYNEKSKDLALKKTAMLWQKEDTLPKSCNTLVNIWQNQPDFDNALLYEKFTHLMKVKKVSAAKKIMKKLKGDDKRYAKLWINIHNNPYRVKNPKNEASDKYRAILAHGLKHWAKKSPDGAAKQWHRLDAQFNFNQDNQQYVFETIALYAALRNNPKAESYFQKLNSEKMPTLHHEWRARHALKKEDWQSLNTIILAFPTPLHEKPCWQYWLARSHDKLGDSDKAISIYQTLSKNRQYYGFLASFQLNNPVNLNAKNYEYDASLIAKHQKTIDEIKTLYQNKKVDKAALLTYELSNDLDDTELYLLAKELADFNWHHKALYYTNKSKHFDDLTIRFPLGYQEIIEQNAENFDIEPAFIFAIIRQESTFRKGVKSHAGALGLMQVIPSTAKRMAKKHQVSLPDIKIMYQPETNIKIGTAYLKHLKGQFDGHPILMAAAYNAGPNQVKRWLKSHEAKEADIWIETLPWHETRNYLKNVMSFLTIYQSRLGKEEGLWLTPISL